MDANNRMLRSALWYAHKGWHVFPIHTPLFNVAGELLGCSCEEWRRTEECKQFKRHMWLSPGEHCKQPGKCPACRWAEKSTTDEETIRKWWGHDWRTKLSDGYSTYYTPNIGIDCGKSDLLTLDVDTYKKNCGDISQLLSAADRETVTAISGSGGEHLIYNRQGLPYGNSCKGLPPGIDIRGDGGYIVAVPSLHKTGRNYAWEYGFGPHEIDPLPIPHVLRDILERSTRHRINHEVGPADIAAVKKSAENVERILNQLGMKHYGQQEYGHGRRWILPVCPFNPPNDQHADDGGTFVIVLEDGHIAAGCHHNRCRHVIDDSGMSGWDYIRSKTAKVMATGTSKYPRVYTTRVAV